jgi:hypothetical protein
MKPGETHYGAYELSQPLADSRSYGENAMSDQKGGPTFRSQQIWIDGQLLRQNVGNVITSRGSDLQTGEIWHRNRMLPVQRRVSDRYWIPGPIAMRPGRSCAP